MTYRNKTEKWVLGVKIDCLSPKATREKIAGHISKGRGVMQVVTAYSEFFVAAGRDPAFKKVLAGAELVVPDGVGPLSAIDYSHHIKPGDGVLEKLVQGVGTGLRVLRGQVGEPVSGVWLCRTLTEMAAKNHWRVFLLGGFGDASYRLAEKFKNNYPGLQILADPGDQPGQTISNEKVLAGINAYQPDILFVAYGPIKQEKWIAGNKAWLRTKVAIGVGGTFNELLGSERPCPQKWQQMGLKWLWRLVWEPKRLGRILTAYPIFPLLVFKEALSQKR